MSIHVITPHRISLSKALWINSIIIVLSYVLLDKLKYELEYILRGQKHLLTFNTKDKSLQRNLLILSQSFLLKIKTFYYFQNTWTNLLITYWKKIFSLHFSQCQVIRAKWGFTFSTSCRKKKMFWLLYFTTTEININSREKNAS